MKTQTRVTAKGRAPNYILVHDPGVAWLVSACRPQVARLGAVHGVPRAADEGLAKLVVMKDTPGSAADTWFRYVLGGGW